MRYPPLKRHPALVPLSREHFNGLVQARRLRLAADEKAPQRRQALSGLLANWSTEMAAHFEDEERLLGPLMDPEDRQRLTTEHGQLRALVSQARDYGPAADPSPGWLRAFAALLDRHIRWEERECYERLQQTRAEELAALIPTARRIERTRRGAAPCSRQPR